MKVVITPGGELWHPRAAAWSSFGREFAFPICQADVWEEAPLRAWWGLKSGLCSGWKILIKFWRIKRKVNFFKI